ncbi:hypothetical protein R1flu_020432 [Riccia fluitans]|uniref:Uncharacterized protein n=1 Tax=Riccia fluitans TaxID=41844 RepID=A0ABD1ZLH9_9MARC
MSFSFSITADHAFAEGLKGVPADWRNRIGSASLPLVSIAILLESRKWAEEGSSSSRARGELHEEPKLRCDCRVNAAVAETERNGGSREKPREAE